MEYSLKFYFGTSTNDSKPIGYLGLGDRDTLIHYWNLFESGIKVSIWFNTFDRTKIHGNAIVDNSAIYNYGEVATDGLVKEQNIYIIITDINLLRFLTADEYANTVLVNSFIEALDIENINRFIKDITK